MLAAATRCRLMVFAIGACLPLCAGATAQRTFVASSGVDNPSCSIGAPCRSLAAAVAATSPTGEVIVLDSAGYGSVTIAKAISISAPAGIYAGISVFAGDGITVTAGVLEDVVLRGLTINGQGGGNGIRVTSGRKIHIVDCKIQNLGQHGILVEGGAATHVARTDLRDNAQEGIHVAPVGAAVIKASVVDTLISGNGGAGILATTPAASSQVDISVLRVTSTGNGASGFAADTGGVGIITMSIANSEAAENGGNGVAILNTYAVGIVSNSALVHNYFADLGQNGATLRTAGNNAVTGRGAGDTAGVLTSNPPK